MKQSDFSPVVRMLLKTDLGQACANLLCHWATVTAHLCQSQTGLDTNAVRNAIRPSNLGAKILLLIDHPTAGDRAAESYSLIITCCSCDQ